MQVELKTNADTPDASSVQKAADFVQAFLLGMSLASSASAGQYWQSCSLLMLPSPTGEHGHHSHRMLVAVVAGFDVADAIALLRLDDLYVEVFEVKDVKVQLLLKALPALYCHAI